MMMVLIMITVVRCTKRDIHGVGFLRMVMMERGLLDERVVCALAWLCGVLRVMVAMILLDMLRLFVRAAWPRFAHI